MNQDRVKEILLEIEDAPLDFSVVFSGKKSKKVNGLYKPDTREILIHNRNFESGEKGDNLLVYTAIHEYAHHLHACKRGGHLSSRAHTTEFWAILHELLEKAEGKRLYTAPLEDSPALKELTETIKTKCLAENGRLVKELGALLLKARDICAEIGLRYEDYVDRVLCVPRAAATLAVKTYKFNLEPRLGSDNLKFLAGISDEEERNTAQKSLLAGKSPDSVKMQTRLSAHPEEVDNKTRLEKEKQRLERTIESLQRRLTEVSEALEQVS